MQTSPDVINRLAADHRHQLQAQADHLCAIPPAPRRRPTRVAAAMLRWLLDRVERRLQPRSYVHPIVRGT